jgi:glutamate formiminotransferase
LLECVVNLSEGRDRTWLDACAANLGPALLDLHADPWHHRSVFTLAGPAVEAITRRLATAAIAHLDLTHHEGVHPRGGVVDVVPFVPLGAEGLRPDGDLSAALAARNRFARWAGDGLGIPCFCYGPERALPDIRRHAFRDLRPDTGPDRPHPTAGAICVGARPALVAYNLWLADPDLAQARRIAAALRSAEVRALGLTVGGEVQVSCNLVAPWRVGPAEVFDQVENSARIARVELVGLVPEKVLAAIPRQRWGSLGLGERSTIEARLAGAGIGFSN